MIRRESASKCEDKMSELFINAGMPKNTAKTLVYLIQNDEATSGDIEKSTGLRQPEVSIAVQELRRRKWVDKRDMKNEGKGRPVHRYMLVKQPDEIICAVEEEAKARIREIQRVIVDLRKELKL